MPLTGILVIILPRSCLLKVIGWHVSFQCASHRQRQICHQNHQQHAAALPLPAKCSSSHFPPGIPVRLALKAFRWDDRWSSHRQIVRTYRSTAQAGTDAHSPTKVSNSHLSSIKLCNVWSKLYLSLCITVQPHQGATCCFSSLQPSEQMLHVEVSC